MVMTPTSRRVGKLKGEGQVKLLAPDLAGGEKEAIFFLIISGEEDGAETQRPRG